MREGVADGQGTLRRDISTALVSLYKEHFGKGPTRCQTYLEPNLMVVILGEGCTAGERLHSAHIAVPATWVGRTCADSVRQ
jgi:uncharacterized protein YbcI